MLAYNLSMSVAKTSPLEDIHWPGATALEDASQPVLADYDLATSLNNGLISEISEILFSEIFLSLSFP